MISDNLMRIVVIFTGVLIIFLLFFADKTNLESSLEAPLRVQAEASLGATEGKLPPLAPEPQFDAWVDSLKVVSESKKIRFLDSIVVNLQARKRFAYAAQYAEELIDLDSSLSNILLAGELYQRALSLPYVQQDTMLLRSFAKQSISYLEEVTAAEPQNERGLLALGLAYVQSGNPQLSMKGIMTLREILAVNPDNVEASFQLGVFSIQTGQFDKAVERFEKVLVLSPDNYSAQLYLAQAQAQLGNTQQAKQLLQSVIDNSSDAELKQAATNFLNQLN